MHASIPGCNGAAGIFVVLALLLPLAVSASESEPNIPIYNRLAGMLNERLMAAGLTPAIPLKDAATNAGCRITQSDLNVMRTKVRMLMENYYLAYPLPVSPTTLVAEDAFEFMADPADGPIFTKVPADCVASNSILLADNFTNLPPLDIHFAELYDALTSMVYVLRSGQWQTGGSANARRGEACLSSLEYTLDDTRLAAESAYALNTYVCACYPCAYAQAGPWFHCGGQAYPYYADIERVRSNYRLDSALTNTPWAVDYYYYAEPYQGQWDANGDPIVSNRWDRWSWSGWDCGAYRESATLGSLGAMPNWICDPASGFYYGGYMISDARAVVHWAFCDPPRPPSGLCADTEEDGLTASACYCADCRPRPAVRREAGMDRAQTDVPLGVSSGLTNADLRIKAVLAEYKAGDAVRQMINLDTAVIEHSENAGEGWEFATVKRPSGAEVTFALCGQKAGRPLNAERRYRLARNGAALELRFAGTDLVVHRFDAAGAIAQVRKTFAHVEVGVNGSPTNWPGMIVERDTGSVRRISSPVYTVELRRVGGLVAAVDYLDAGGALQQTLEILSGSRIFRLLDAGGAAIEETKIVSTGNVEEIWLGVGAGGASAAAKQIAEMAYDRTNLLTTRTLTTIYHPGGADESRAISCEVSQGFPWGEELVAQTEGFGSADPQTTSYAYYTNPAITGCFGRLRLAEYPDGSWVRYEYDGLGRANAVYRPLKNAPPSAGGGDCRLAEYFYAADPSLAGFGFPLDDVTATNDPRPRLIVEKIGGVEVTRTYHSYAAAEQRERRCANQGADYGDSENLVTKTEAYTTGAFQGRVRRILHPDGTLSVFSYAYNPASDELTVVRETGAGSGYGVTSGKRTTTVRDSADRIVSIRIEDIESDMCLSETQYERDGWGRVLRELNTVTHSERRMEYGCCGPERLIDDEGIETTIGYDELKQPVVTTRNGVTAVTAYDARGNVVSVTRTAAGCPPLGTVNTYDACGRLIAARDERGFTTTLAYGINGLGERTVTATYPDHSTSIDTVYRDGQPHSLKGTAVHPLVYDYGADVDGSYTVEYRGDDSCGLPSEWIRTSTDMLGRNAKIVYPGGYTETFSYDSLGRLVKTSDGLTAQLFAYNALGEMWREARDMNGNGAIDPAGNDKLTETETAVATFGGKDVRETTVRVYPAAGSGVAEVLAVMRTALEGSETWSTTLGRTRHVVITRNPAAAARTVTVTNPDGTHSIACYTNNLLMASVETDRTGATVSERRCRYDAFGRLSAAIEIPLTGPARETVYEYDPAGNVLRLAESSGGFTRATLFAYDSLGRRIRTTFPSGSQVELEYSARGEVVRQSGSAAYPLAFAYNDQGRLTALSTYRNGADADADVTHWDYDAQRGWLTSKTYAGGTAPVQYEYYLNGALKKRVWSRGVSAQYAYDGAGLLTSIAYSDATPPVALTRDRMGRAIEIADGVGGHTNSYRLDGQLALAIPPLAHGAAVEYLFDATDRVTGRTVRVNGNAVFASRLTYDDAGRVQVVSDGRHSAAYAYGADGRRPTDIQLERDAVPVVAVARSYDELGRLTAVESSAAAAFAVGREYDYDSADRRVKSRAPDGATWTYGYDARSQLTLGKKRHASGALVPGAQWTYGYDTIGNRKHSSDWEDEVTTYAANALNQYVSRTAPRKVLVTGTVGTGVMVSVSAPSERARLANRQDEQFWRTWRITNNNQAVTVTNVVIAALSTATSCLVRTATLRTRLPPNPALFAYDDDGNLIEDGLWFYAWDAENRLIAVTPKSAEESTPKLEFAYDYLGRRVGKKVFFWATDHWSLTTDYSFIYDGWNPVTEIRSQSSEVSTNFYAWGSDLSGTMGGAGGVGGLLWSTAVSATNPPATRFYLYDGNGNVIALADAAGSGLTAEYDYGPFGEIANSAGPDADSNPWRFSARYTDPETGLIMYPKRLYSLSLGRFLSRDPIEEDGGLNLYTFVFNNPVDYIDPWGLALYAFDGTWNDRDKMKRPTNVAKLAAVYDGLVAYRKGVGTDWYTKHIGGITGAGGGNRIEDMYADLVRIYNTPDPTSENQQIDVIGFSRGAALSRTFINYINSKGGVPLLGSDGRPTGVVCPVKIRFLGLFDTVGSFGIIPGNNINPGHDFSIPQNVENVRHAVALDEKRGMFPLSSVLSDPNNPSADPRIVEMGFRGAHSDIGGGYGDGDLSNFALMWMHDEGVAVGVPFSSLPSEDIGAQNPIIHDERGWWERWLDRQRKIYYMNTGR